MARWTEQDIPDLRGRTALVTGASSGLGLATARQLAARGAHVILGCRTEADAERAIHSIRAAVGSSSLEALPIDLSNLASVRCAADTVTQRHEHLHLLVNNAGVMGLPLMRTADGFEMLFGTNHLGHFALSGLLLDRLRHTAEARVVSIASLAHRSGQMPLDDLNWDRRPYAKGGAYAQSKLANLMFALELDRRLRAAGIPVRSIAAHPGYAATNIFYGGDVAGRSVLRTAWNGMARLGAAWVAQPAALGALPSLFAATAPEAESGGYYGPGGFIEFRGYPSPVQASLRARDPALGAGLWEASERLTGVRWQFS